MNFRRSFTSACFVTGLAVRSMSAAFGADAAFQDVSVADFGAIPNDGKDDAAAIRSAVAACKGKSNPRLVFPRGVYHLSSTAKGSSAFIELNDFPTITLQGNGSELVGTETKTLLLFQRCARVFASGLDVDWNPLPFTGGKVVASTEDSIDVEIDASHQLRVGTPVQSVMTYDAVRHFPLRTGEPGALTITQKAYTKPTEEVRPGVLRIFLAPKPEILRSTKPGQRAPLVGDTVLAWYVVRGGGAFRPAGCGDVTFEDCRVFAVAGMGFAANTCDRITLRRCAVVPKPGSGRWMSSSVDASHNNMVRQRVEYVDCVFEGMGDDATNVHGMYSMVHERPDARTLVLRGWKSIFNEPVITDDFAAPAQNSYRPDETLEFSTKEDPLRPVFTAKIVETTPVTVKGLTVKRVRLDRDLADFVTAGSIVANANEIPEFIFRHCTVRGGRGIGVRLKTRHAIVEDSTFEDVYGPGVWVTCDSEVDHESIATRDVVVRNNRFIRTSPAVSSSAGRKREFPEIHEGLVVEGNRIEEARGIAINLKSTVNAIVRDNRISTKSDEPIRVTLSRGATIEKNTIEKLSVAER